MFIFNGRHTRRSVLLALGGATLLSACGKPADTLGWHDPDPAVSGLPPLGPEDVLGQLRLAEETASISRWFAQLNDWVRATILPRMAEG